MTLNIILASLFAYASFEWARRSWKKGYVAGYEAGALAMRNQIFAQLGIISPEDEIDEVEASCRSQD